MLTRIRRWALYRWPDLLRHTCRCACSRKPSRGNYLRHGVCGPCICGR